MALCLFVQLWFPYLPLYSIAYMLGTCLLHSFVANDEKEDYKRERLEAEKVKGLKDRLYAVLENMPGMTFTKDAQTGKNLACNQAVLRFCIKDTGIGIDKENIPKIFDEFSQDDGAGRSKFGSSGLGLAIANKIVELMNGSIEVESEKGVGTVFTVIVTLHKGNKKENGHVGELDPNSLCILVADDNPIEAQRALLVWRTALKSLFTRRA